MAASCAKRASPTFSLAMAYFSSPVASGSSVDDVLDEGAVWRACEEARLARAMA